MRRLSKGAVAAGAALAMVSCAAVSSFTGSAVSKVKTTGSNLWAKVPSLPKTGLFAERPEVVQVRPGDMKKLKLGHEQALAFQKSGGVPRWAVGDVKFVPPELPPVGSEEAVGVLPPILLPETGQ